METSWDDLRILLAVHRQRSFLAAGRALGMSTSTAARRIGALERALGRGLVHRGASGTTLEPDALPLVALAEQLEAGLAATRRDQAGPAPLAGVVRVSIGEGFVAPVVQLLAAFRDRHPEARIELAAEPRLANLARREADLGLRTVRSSVAALVEKRLGALRFGLFAGRGYAARRLPDRRLRRGELGRHDVVGYDGALRGLPPQRWLIERGATRFAFRASSDGAVLEAALRDQGLAVLAELTARDVPGLVRIELDDGPPGLDLFLVCHRDLRRVARIRAVADALAHGLRAHLG